MKQEKILITGGNGQLGRALQEIYPKATAIDVDDLDITDQSQIDSFDWSGYSAIINAAAYTQVDEAEKPENRDKVFDVNAKAVEYLAKTALKHELVMVHVSSDYVFDGIMTNHQEDELSNPLNVYGESKAVGDIAVEALRKFYLIRTSWVVGGGHNFIKTFYNLAKDKEKVRQVVNDQFGRLTFAEDLAVAIARLIDTDQPYGVYNVSNGGPVVSWADIAKSVYKLVGADPNLIVGISTEEYFKGKEFIANRPKNSDFNLSRIEATGFKPRDWREAENKYIQELKEEEQ